MFGLRLKHNDTSEEAACLRPDMQTSCVFSQFPSSSLFVALPLGQVTPRGRSKPWSFELRVNVILVAVHQSLSPRPRTQGSVTSQAGAAKYISLPEFALIL